MIKRELKFRRKISQMSEIPKNCKASVIPALHYRDAPAAIEWLCQALGFEKQAVYPNPDGTIAHSQLTFGNGMVMVSSVSGSEYGKLVKQPREVGMANTQSSCLIVNDADQVYAVIQAHKAARMARDRHNEERGMDNAESMRLCRAELDVLHALYETVPPTIAGHGTKWLYIAVGGAWNAEGHADEWHFDGGALECFEASMKALIKA